MFTRIPGSARKGSQRSRNGRRLSWFVCFENDGALPDNLKGRGFRSSRDFSVKYVKGNRNLTAAHGLPADS